jgi:hypothetical protein
LWHAFFAAAFKDMPPEPFAKPDPLIPGKIMLNGIYTSAENPQPHSILYYVNRADPLGPPPSDPTADPQFRNWEAVVRARYGF